MASTLKTLSKEGPIFHHREPGPFMQVEELPKLAGASLDAGQVVPGQPISVEWGVYSWLPKDFGAVTAHIFLDRFNALLHESQTVAAGVLSFLNALNGSPFRRQAQIAPPPIGGVASALYQIGTKSLRLDVASDKTSETFTRIVDLEVLPDDVHGGWWEWGNVQGTVNPDASPSTRPLQPQAHMVINHPYTVTGRMVNRSTNPGVTMTGFLTLEETEAGTSRTTQVETITFTLPPGATQDVIFRDIKKDWLWLIPSIWVRHFGEPLNKGYWYVVRFTLSDPYGNVYHDVKSNLTLTVDVAVTDEKNAYASAALGVLAAGVVVAIFTFGAGLSAAMGVAGALGAKALDPPEPDSRYRDRVDVGVREAGGTDKQFAEIMQVLHLAERVIALIDALGDIENRLLSARVAQDPSAIDMQTETCCAVEKELQETVGLLVESVPSAVAAIHTDSRMGRDALEAAIRSWQRQGMPVEVRKRLIEEGCTDETLTAVMAAICDPTVAALAQQLPRAIEVLASSLVIACRASTK